MSKFLAWIIVAFARSVTFPFGARRQMKALLRVEQRLKPDTLSICVAGSRTLRVSATSRASISRFMRLREIEPDTIEWLDGLPDDPVTLWDIGANLGLYSLYAAGRDNIQVLAFEPGAASYRVLNDNIEMNAMDHRITALPVALCQETKLDMLNMGSTHEGGSMHGFGVEVDQFGGAIDTQFRQGAIGFSIDDFVQLFHPPLPTHLKIDVDGLEPDILRGGRNTISMPNVRSVILEVEGDEARSRELVELMAEFGFVPKGKGSSTYRNIVFDRQPETR